MFDFIVVGGGLFGSVAARVLRVSGAKVLMLDAAHKEAGSGPAACLMKPSWFSSLGKEVYKPSLELVDRLYGVQDLSFKVLMGHATVHWCDPAKILAEPKQQATVRRIVVAQKHWQVETNKEEYSARHVVLAAGIWTPMLTPVEGGLVGQAGLACLWAKAKLDIPFVRVWAPYRQITAFNRGDGVWCGDSTAIRAQNWTEKHASAVEQRCSNAVGLTKPQRLFGIRPYSAMKPCYLKEARPGLWVATGGAKNGTIAAGWCAHKILEAVA